MLRQSEITSDNISYFHGASVLLAVHRPKKLELQTAAMDRLSVINYPNLHPSKWHKSTEGDRKRTTASMKAFESIILNITANVLILALTTTERWKPEDWETTPVPRNPPKLMLQISWRKDRWKAEWQRLRLRYIRSPYPLVSRWHR